MSISVSPVQFSSGLVNTDQVSDFFKTLVLQNAARLKSCHKRLKKNGSVDTEELLLSVKCRAAEYIMHLCDQWKYSEEVKFTAIEIYGKFLRLLLVEIFHSVYGRHENLDQLSFSQDIKAVKQKQLSDKKFASGMTKIKLENQNNQWEQTIEHIAGQMELRAVTCISIASKFFSHYSHVTCHVAMKYLASRGLKYKPDVLLKSEVRILKTLQFNIRSLPLVLPYISALLDLMSAQEKRMLGQEIYQLCIDLLVCFYPRCYQVYDTFLKNVLKQNKGDLKLSEITNDMLLLACGIVASATYLQSKPESDTAVKVLSDLTKVSQESIAKFAYILMDVSLN